MTMNNFNILKNPLTKNYSDLKEIIFGPNMSWLYQKETLDHMVDRLDDYQDVPLYYHNVLQRPETKDEYLNVNNTESRIRSGVYDRFKVVLDEIFVANNITVKNYYRIGVNSCCNVNKPTRSPIHVDHPFPHNQLLIYLTDSSATTNIYSEKFICDSSDSKNIKFFNSYHFGGEKKEMMLKIFPNEDRIVTFDGLYYHSYDYPLNDEKRRILIVCTYNV